MAQRDDLMRQVCTLAGIQQVPKGVGSSVHNDFLNPLTRAVGLDPDEYRNKYRRIEAVLRRLGQDYDPASDTSEATASGGAGTLTNDGLRKLLRGLRGRPDRIIPRDRRR